MKYIHLSTHLHYVLGFARTLFLLPILCLPLLVSAQEGDESLAEQEEDESLVEEVIVTVERREQSLQDLPGTAASFSGEEMKLLGIQNIDDLDGSLPGLSIANNAGNIEVYIRGIGSSNNTELGDPAAATHLNGVYVPRPSGFGAAFFDIERVEVNVGPQGTLRGRNATAGSINVIPWKPGTEQADGMLEVSLGNYDERRVEGMANVPVTENSAFRIAGFSLQHDSYYENENPDSTELGLDIPTAESEGIEVAEAADDLGFRATYLIESMGALHESLDELGWTVTYDSIRQEGTGYTGTNYASLLGAGLDPDRIKDPRKVLVRPISPDENVKHYGIKSQIDYVAPWFDVEYIASYRDLVYDYQWAGAADTVAYPGALDNFNFDNFDRIQSITDSESEVHELRLFADDLSSLPVRWTAGAFYFEEQQRTFLGTASDRNAFFNGVEFNQRTDTESKSLYGDATWSVTDKFRLTGGLRYTEDQKERTGVNARYAFILGGAGFGLAATSLGTEGFRFRGLDRTIINPNTNTVGDSAIQQTDSQGRPAVVRDDMDQPVLDGMGREMPIFFTNAQLIDNDEAIAFYLDGVARFGARDGLGQVLSNGAVAGDAPVEEHPLCPDIYIGSGCPVVGGSVDFDDHLAGRVAFVAPTGSIALQNGELDNDFVDWRLRAEYDIGDDSLLYGLIATGNKSGGFNDNLPPSAGTISLSGDSFLAFDASTPAPTYDEESVTLYEIGSKNEFELGDFFDAEADVGMRFNATGFYYDYEDLQVFNLLSSAQILTLEGLPQPANLNLGGNVVGFTFNASDAEIYGFQLEGEFRFPGNWNLDYTFLRLETEIKKSREVQDSRFQSDVDGRNATFRSIEGHRLPRTPEYQFNASLSKAITLSGGGSFDAIISAGYRSSQHMTIFNGRVYERNALPTDPPEETDDERVARTSQRLDDEVDGYWTLDVGAGYSVGDEDDLRVEGYISNLTDEEQEQAIIITQFDNTRFFSRPRTYGVRLRMRF